MNQTSTQQAATTVCWSCDNCYAMTSIQCPRCEATNANRSLETAHAELVGMSNDDEPMAVYRGVSL